MASVSRKPRSPYWAAKFCAEDGRIVQRSTKQTNRKAAQIVADEWERAAKKARAGELTQAATLKILGELMERTIGETIDRRSVQQFFADWLNIPGRKSSTIARYRPVLDGFIQFLGPVRARATVGSVTPSEIQKYRDQQITDGKSETTANLFLSVLRAVFDYARRVGLSLANPAAAVLPLDSSNADERLPFTSDQLRAILKNADQEWRGMVLFGNYTGIRIGDAARLTWQNVDLVTRVLTFRDAKTSARKRKGEKETRIYLHDELLRYLEHLPSTDDPDAPLFPSLYEKTTGSHAGLSNAFNRLMVKTGIVSPLGQEKSGKGRTFRLLGFHSLRHTLFTNFANADVPADVRKAIAGHASDEIHRRYVHLDLATQRRALEKIPALK